MIRARASDITSLTSIVDRKSFDLMKFSQKLRSFVAIDIGSFVRNSREEDVVDRITSINSKIFLFFRRERAQVGHTSFSQTTLVIIKSSFNLCFHLPQTAPSPSRLGEPTQIAQISAAPAATVSAPLQLRTIAASRSARDRTGLSTSENCRCIERILSSQSAVQTWARRGRSIRCKFEKLKSISDIENEICVWTK